MSSSAEFARSTETNWRDLYHFSKLEKNQEPSIYSGELADPTSWSQWICCGCCNDREPKRVIAYLQNMNKNISKDLEKNEELSNEKCKVVGLAISNFERLSNLYGSKQVRAIQDGILDDAEEYKQISEKLTIMKDQLAYAAVGNQSYVTYARENDLIKKIE